MRDADANARRRHLCHAGVGRAPLDAATHLRAMGRADDCGDAQTSRRHAHTVARPPPEWHDWLLNATSRADRAAKQQQQPPPYPIILCSTTSSRTLSNQLAAQHGDWLRCNLSLPYCRHRLLAVNRAATAASWPIERLGCKCAAARARRAQFPALWPRLPQFGGEQRLPHCVHQRDDFNASDARRATRLLTEQQLRRL